MHLSLILTLTSPPQFVECVSDANPAVNCTVQVVTADVSEEGNDRPYCLLQLQATACTTMVCDFDCTVSNSVNPTGARAKISFTVV
jgi:hypothetical protein